MAGKTSKNKKSASKKSGSKSGSAAARPRRKSGAMKGVAKIPKLTTAAGIIAANAEPLAWTVKQSFNNPRATLNYVKASANAMIRPENLAKTAKAALIGYGVGYVAKKYAPKIIKKPMAKIAAKVM